MLWFYRWIVNPILIRLLRSPLHFLASDRIMLITYVGRRPGRRIVPVRYRASNSEIVVRVGRYWDKRWWKNFESETPVELQLRGRPVAAFAQAVKSAFGVRVYIRTTEPVS